MNEPVLEVVDLDVRSRSRTRLVRPACISVSAPAFDRPGDADVSVRERL